jgi:hypothetical protein
MDLAAGLRIRIQIKDGQFRHAVRSLLYYHVRSLQLVVEARYLGRSSFRVFNWFGLSITASPEGTPLVWRIWATMLMTSLGATEPGLSGGMVLIIRLYSDRMVC